MVMTTKMKGSIPCKCDRGERQRAEDEWARTMGRAPKVQGHTAQCPIVRLHRMRQLERKIEEMGNTLTLPDPVLSSLNDERLADLVAQRDGLRKGLAQYLTTEVASSGGSTADGKESE